MRNPTQMLEKKSVAVYYFYFSNCYVLKSNTLLLYCLVLLLFV